MASTCTNAIECCEPSPFESLAVSGVVDAGCGADECCEPSPFSVIPDSGIPISTVCTVLGMDDFSVWFEGAPMVCESGDEDFGLWLDGAPFVESQNT